MPTTLSVPATRSDTGKLPTLAATNLACRRGNRLLFTGVNFSVDAGQGFEAFQAGLGGSRTLARPASLFASQLGEAFTEPADLFRRHNSAEASLNPELRDEARVMLDAIVVCRQKYVDKG